MYLSQVFPDYLTGALVVQGTLNSQGGTSSGPVSAASVSTTGGHQLGNGTVAGPTLWGGSGVPAGTLGAIGDYYFRSDTPGTANQRLYVKTAAGTWTAIL